MGLSPGDLKIATGVCVLALLAGRSRRKPSGGERMLLYPVDERSDAYSTTCMPSRVSTRRSTARTA